MRPLILTVLTCSLIAQNGFSQSSTTSTRSVSESERLIPLAYDVDVVVASMTAAARRVVTPMAVKSALDKALLDSKVNFLYGSYVTEVLQYPQGKLAGVVVANRSGRQAVRGKVIIDATDRAAAARIAGARFTPYPSGPQTFSRIVLGGKPGPKARDTGLRYRVVGKKSNVYPSMNMW